jgi:chromate transporter
MHGGFPQLFACLCRSRPAAQSTGLARRAGAGIDGAMSAPLSPPSLPAFCLAYLRIGLIGFGGVNAWARRVLVEEKRWISEQDYAEVLGIGQVLPGANALNVAIQLGERWHGAAGAIGGAVSLFGAPMLLLIGLAVLHDSYGEVALVRATLAGTAAAAAGMVIGTALKMTQNLRPALPIIAVGLAALFAAAVLRAPLPLIVLGLGPFGILAAWWVEGRR